MAICKLFATMLTIAMIGSLSHAQTASMAEAKTQQLDKESTKILSALQLQLRSLPPVTKQGVFGEIDGLAIQNPTTPQLGPFGGRAQRLLDLDPAGLTLGQKMQNIGIMIDASRPQVQQVVNPALPAEPAAASALNALADTLNGFPSNGRRVSAATLSALSVKAKSIGRVVWTFQDLLDKGDPMWQLAGTGFVSSPGVVTTACHVVSQIADVAAGQAKIRSGVVVRIDFSDGAVYGQLLPITNIIAISKTMGCDIAQLAFDGGTSLLPLKMAAATAATRRVVVIGYPMLNNYTLDDCSAPGSNATETQFCGFHRANPETSKVMSPGGVLTCCDDDHGAVSVLTYNAPTDGGQSGSPVFDADTLAVVGVHYCCTGGSGSIGLMDCDTWHPQNIKWNEAITTQSLLNDSSLKDHFSDTEIGQPVVAALQPNSHPMVFVVASPGIRQLDIQ